MSREIDCPVRNMKLDDKECILVQFKNERKKPVQVAFQAWLKNKDNVQINNEVIIKWPIDVDVLCAKAMEKKQKTMKADQWQDLVVKILAIGKWTDMAQQAKNIEKFGIANPTRE
ncbi:uncharacterized protein LOC109863378, partial [Pseudomyrmex gracilis]|uniref:uncharacterized protein LOC109863378 n=1 Tax=Pseudomyrmex gracilis TaxID=219809 RepID=UPI000994902B